MDMKVLLLCGLVTVLQSGQSVPLGSETISIEYLDPCRNPKDPGPCEALVPSFYYNNETGTCEEFSYGGCKGNANRFPSSEECKAACVTREKHICNLTPEPGVCLASFLRYFYDPTEKRCKTFTYGGCQGNGNNFKTLSECSFTCAPQVSNSHCDLPSDSGNCYAHMIRYFYDRETGTCPTFVYGGCQGNENRFGSEQKCLLECGKKDTIPKLRNAPIIDSLDCSNTKCDQRSIDDYKLRGCKPVMSEKNCCPVRYECPEKQYDPSKCYLKGTFYKIDDKVDSPTACLKNCSCSKAPNNDTEVKCDKTDCPRNEPVEIDSHYDYYTSGECCPTWKPRSKEAITCDVDGRKYTEGEKIHFNDKCRICLCTKDYTGPDGPGCEKEFCGLAHDSKLLQGCVPAYEGKGCCPTKWLCPADHKALSSARNSVDCISPREAGVCEEAIERFYYDPIQQKCLNFTYTGCGGNTNNFVSQEECQSTCKDVKPRDVCKSDAKTGHCKAAHVRWYHNDKEGKCQTFIYGGCGGNFNNFKSQEECEDLCQPRLAKSDETEVKTEDACSLDADVGPCKAFRPSFYFDKHSGECKDFVYGGCQGNANRFTTQDECLSRCVRKPAFKIEGRSIEVADPCSLPKDVGPCKAAMPRFYFNSNTGVCESFVYGGCQGNANNFLRMEECHSLCAGLSEKSSRITKEKICQMPPVLGTCKAILLRFHFDPSDQQCKSFVYGGCEGNQNNFETEERCLDFCLPQENETRDLSIEDAPKICSQTKETGKCKGKLKRYYYDVESKSCLPFYYGGCGGNDNKFESVEECDLFCAAKKNEVPTKSLDSTDGVCSLPKTVGPCKALHKRYYYDSDLGYCKTFNYGGCQGNNNNFLTLADCEGKCGFRPRPGHENDYCTYGNKTIPLGSDLTLKDDPCLTCVCETPPHMSCRNEICPQLLLSEGCIIEPPKAGECCEGYSCGHNKDQKKVQTSEESLAPGKATSEAPDSARTKRQLSAEKKPKGCNPSCGSGEVCVHVAPCSGCSKIKQCTPRDKSCEGHKCPRGTVCELQQVQCFAAPCYPITVCNPK